MPWASSRSSALRPPPATPPGASFQLIQVEFTAFQFTCNSDIANSQNRGHTVVNVVTKVKRTSTGPGPASGLIQVLYAQPLCLDELEQVGPLQLLDAAEQEVLRMGRAVRVNVATPATASCS